MGGDKRGNTVANLLNIQGVFVEHSAQVEPWGMRVRWGRVTKAKRVVGSIATSAPFDMTFKELVKEIKSYAPVAGQPHCIQLGREAWQWFKRVRTA